LFRINGCGFLEALELWADPSEFARIRDKLHLAQFQTNPALRFKVLTELTTPLQEKLFSRLRRQELLASAQSFSLPAIGSRTVLPSSTYELAGLSFNWGWNALEAPGHVFRGVEFFLPDDPPILLQDQVARLLGRTQGHLLPSLPFAVQSPESAAFWHDDTYEHVRLQGCDFSLSKVQSAIVERLHKASGTTSPWVHLNELRDGIGFSTAKLSDLFKRQKDWRRLIASDGRGFYRLNL
jgi:hypothetical protein